MSDFSDPCPPPLFPADPLTVLPTSYVTESCGMGYQYKGWLLNENGVDFVLQEDGISFIAI